MEVIGRMEVAMETGDGTGNGNDNDNEKAKEHQGDEIA